MHPTKSNSLILIIRKLPEISQILHSKFPYEPTEGQLQFFNILDSMFGKKSAQKDTLIVKGYAGTGKTTLVSTLVGVLPLFNYRFMLLAPTGRAAKVLSSYALKTSYTIHKIIYKQVADPKSGDLHFVRQKNYFRKTVFIVDEASLISDDAVHAENSLLKDLIEYVFEKPDNKLFLIGDTAQLPPVGSLESPALQTEYLRDYFGLDLSDIELKDVIRQEKDSGILLNATGLRTSINSRSPGICLSTSGFKDIFRMSTDRLEDGLRYAYDKYGIENTAIICKSNWQAVRYNEYIRRNILFREDEIETGDILMIVRNNYFFLEEDSPASFIANGDFAEIRKIFSYEDMFGFRFARLELQLVDYPDMQPFEARVILDTLHSNTPALSQEESKKLYHEVSQSYTGIKSRKKFKEAIQADEYLNALQVKFAYALTCHKSQGGQWEIVFIDPGVERNDALEIEKIRWLYTAITRAQREVYMINFNPKYFQTE